MENLKVKSAAKISLPHGPDLEKKVLDTMAKISLMVGGTLGPGGRPVLIERPEHNLPPYLSKDGVTVFKAMGEMDPVAHCILEVARDAATKTVQSAGDGTSTASVLAEALVLATHKYCKANPRISPQRVVRHIQKIFTDKIEPLIKSLAIKTDFSEKGKKLLYSVAKVSANGDEDLAKAVMEAFDITGDEGNVTILEASGPFGYKVEKLEGYYVPDGGYEELGVLASKFINQTDRQRTYLERPYVICYNGYISDIQMLYPIMTQVGEAWEADKRKPRNILLVATGFSSDVIGHLATGFPHPDTLNVFPFKAPLSPISNGQTHFLYDLCAVTNGTLFDPLNKPLEMAELGQLGTNKGYFECHRFNATLVGFADEDTVLLRIEELRTLVANPESRLDERILNERIAKLANGIAKLKIVGSANGELKERRDRAEDAVCSVRAAIKHGCLPGGCWTLNRIIKELSGTADTIVRDILLVALQVPFKRLLNNCGILEEEYKHLCITAGEHLDQGSTLTFDVTKEEFVDPVEGGILDSVPAVLEALRNSISMATNLGTLGGAIVFGRDLELERSETTATNRFLEDANS